MLFLANYADEKFRASQKFNTQTAFRIGGFDDVFEYSPPLIDKMFFEKNRAILGSPKGGGYWLWKPYIIKEALSKINENDILIYADSGSHFIHNAKEIAILPEIFNQDVIPFEMELPESSWTKRDAFVLMNADSFSFEKSNQRLASFMVIKKSPLSMKFIDEYLAYCCNERIITDIPNTCGLPNYQDFKEHRHDQSVFSLLSKKYGLTAFRDPSQWGNPRIAEFKNSPYPQIIEHTRHKVPKHAKLSYRIKRFFWKKKKH
jgi:hypothetical protein